MNSIALLFPGQGAFYGGVLQDTRLFYPRVQQVLEQVEAVALARFGRSLTAAIWQSQSSAELLLKQDPALLQLAIFTVSVAAFEMLRAEGVTPGVLVGHSLGEIAALTCAGVFSLEQGADIVCDRVESLRDEAPQNGAMASISAPAQQVLGLINSWQAATLGSGAAAEPTAMDSAAIAIAVENHEGQTVVSGPRRAIDSFMALCASLGVSNQLLNAPYAFHHPDLAAAKANFARRLCAYPTAALQYPVYSPILCRYYQDGDNFGSLIAQHLVVPVKFSTAIRQLFHQGVNVLVEAGALNALSKIVIRILGPGKARVFPTLEQQDGELTGIRTIIHHLQQDIVMNTPKTNDVITADFEAYWNDRAPILMAQIKAEFLGFFTTEQTKRPAAPIPAVHSPAVHSPATHSPATHSPATHSPATTASVVHMVAPSKPAAAPEVLARPTLFSELVTIYAEAMEYPTEVFSETVELEAELGIDSVKQTEIIGRIRTQYQLPPMPANFRSGDFKTMGQIVDFVYSQQGLATPA